MLIYRQEDWEKPKEAGDKEMLSKDVCLWCEANDERAVEPEMS